MGDVICELLRTLPLARHFSEDLIEELALLAQPRRLGPRERIVSRGDEVQGIHVVREGAVLLELPVSGEMPRIVHQVLLGDHPPRALPRGTIAG